MIKRHITHIYIIYYFSSQTCFCWRENEQKAESIGMRQWIKGINKLGYFYLLAKVLLYYSPSFLQPFLWSKWFGSKDPNGFFLIELIFFPARELVLACPHNLKKLLNFCNILSENLFCNRCLEDSSCYWKVFAWLKYKKYLLGLPVFLNFT